MAPAAKRKRGDNRAYSHDSNDGSSRASPHRPQDLELGQRNQQGSTRGGRRGSRGGRGGSNAPRSPSSNANANKQTSPLTNQAMSPPTVPTPKPTAPVTSPAQAPAPTEQPPPQSSVSQTPYFYQYLSDERLASWKDAGQRAVVDAATQWQSEEDIMALSCLFQELVRAAMDAKLSPTDVGATVQEILASWPESGAMDLVSLFLDCVSILTEADFSNPNLQSLLSSTGIDPARMRAELETNLLVADNLVRTTFTKMAIRKGTYVLYRQSAYNLLREEGEGYSKLMTEYFTTVNSAPPSDIVVTETFQRVKALIGAFDLDVGRVLDITLDVFANLLVKHNDFFIKLLRTSSWWPEQKTIQGVEWEDQGFSSLPNWALPGYHNWFSTDEEKDRLSKLREVRDRKFWDRVRDPAVGLSAFFELGSRRITSDISALELNGLSESTDITEAAADKKKAAPTDSEKIQKWTREWIAATHTLPPSGNRIAAQLLGFKLRFYASDVRDPTDILPDNLIVLAALLIKIGFISLADLYPHLYPLDEDMPALKEKLTKEKIENERKTRGGGASNALANAGALSDDTKDSRTREAERQAALKAEANGDKGTPSKIEEEAKESLPEPVDQKTDLLRKLLCIGSIPEALFILGRFPWLLDLYPDLLPYIFRILNHSLGKVYDEARPMSDEPDLKAPKKSPVDDSSKGQRRPTDFPPRKNLRWLKLDQKDAGDGTDYRFYWEDWADNVPVCQSVDDVFALCNTLLNLVSFKFGEDPMLLTKLARIGRKNLVDDPSEKNTQRWIDLSRRLLAPALSFTRRNPGVVNEVFDLLKCFPTQTRYSIYSEWFTGATSRTPQMSANFNGVKLETKHVLKRISKTNVKPMARSLAKAAYASPGVVFQVALSQIESYENLTDVVIECGRYFTYLAYDVLTWALMNSLGGVDRNRVQADGMLTSAWLRSLATFAGKVFKRYTVMSPTPVLQYVGNQLLRGSSHDLEVLEQIIVSMAGISSDVTLNDSQIQAMSGGELIRQYTRENHLGDKRHELRGPSKRLMRSLTDTGLAAQLLIAIAQERQAYLFRDASRDAPLKVLGANMDRIHQIFSQYLEFLRSGLTVKDFDAIIPGVITLISDFGIDHSIAFAIARDSIRLAVEEATVLVKAEKAEKAKKIQEVKDAAQSTSPTNGDVEMVEASDAPTTNGDHTTEDAAMIVEPTMPPSADVHSPTDASQITSAASSKGPWNPVLQELMVRLRPLLPANFEERFSLSFYVTFWQLALHDLSCPTGEYESTIGHLRERMPKNDRRDVSAAGAKKREMDKKWYMDEQDKIRGEMKGHIHSYSEMRKRLKEEKEHWFDGFPMMDAKSEHLHYSIFQDCFLPRMLLSSEDAHFAFVMLKYLHSSGVPGFRTMKFLDQFFRQKQLTALMFQCTAREAENLGRFINETLVELKTWHDDEKTYKIQGQGPKQELPGFGRSFKPDRSPATFIDFEDFRRVLFKWHSQLFRALDAALNSGEYMHIRNAINILKAVNQSFPIVDFMGKGLNKVVQTLATSEKRGDLKLSANSLLGDFKRGEKRWVISQAFHINKAGLNPPPNASRSNSEKPSTPQSASNSGSLSAAAPPFAPRSTPFNGISKPALTSKEVEDGEVEDEKRQAMANALAQSKEQESSKSSAPSVQEKSINLPTREPDQTQHTSQPLESRPLDLTPQMQSGSAPSRPERPDSRGGPNRPLHALPVRPDTQAPVRGPGRISDRPLDRPSEYNNHGRHDGRSVSNTEYGRLDRPGETYPEPFRGRRDGSPGRGPRGRTPERGAPLDRDRRDPGWAPPRDSREYSDDRGMRPPPRDIRPPGGRGPGWGDSPRDNRDPRDVRDLRDPRDRMQMPMDSRGPPPPVDSRSRMHSGPPMPPSGTSPYHGSNRDPPPNADRSGYMPSKAPSDRPRNQPFDRPLLPNDRSSINAERAPFIDDRSRPENFNSDRDGRRDRGSRPHSPRRDERGPPTYPPRGDPPRDHRDDRGPPPERLPPPSFPLQNRDRREDAGADAPTGPRGPRNDYAQPPRRGGPEMFQPNAPPPRPSGESDHGRLSKEFKDFPLPPRPNQQQESTFGRLNAPTDNIPSGPRGRTVPGRGGRNFTAPVGHGFPRGGDSPQIPSSPAADRPPGPLTDRRDRRESGPMDTTHQSGPPAQSTDQPQDMSGIHPSRQTAFQGPKLQTDIPPQMTGAPSGPRGSQRTPITSTGPSPISRNPPTGPASATERGSGLENKTLAAQFRRHLQPSNPTAEPSSNNSSFERNDRNDRGNTDRGASIRGRASRPGGPGGPMGPNNSSGHNTSSPGGSQPSTPNPHGPSRLERSEFPAPTRGENVPQDDGRSDSRTRREGRRSERTRHHSRDRSKNADRKGEEKPRGEEDGKERSDRSSGREKRGGSDRESSRRERTERGDRESGERRDGRERRERGSTRDEGGRREPASGNGRGEEGGLRRGGPPMVEGEMPGWADQRMDGRNGDSRARGSGDRGGRDRRDGGREERDARKRRGGEELVHGDNKRPRRSNA